MGLAPEFRARVQAWIADDPDERDQAELRALLTAASGQGDSAGELRDRFAGRLEFGTAGLRGPMGAGPNRMNRAVVRGATAAVAGWLADADTRHHLSVVVGCDARHRSAEFADEAARVLAGAGLRVHLLPRPCPTPLLAFAVRHLSAGAGIMITASHNPAPDNGYKLYASDGAQIIPPADADIEARIARLAALAAVPVASLDSPLVVQHGDDVASAYLEALTAAVSLTGTVSQTATAAETPRPALTVVYTPMHGVAGGLMLRAIAQAGFAAPRVVRAQGEPDPDFPTARFPNPEEPGALDLAIADARSAGADLVLASDPDGDRLAVAVPGRGSTDGGWRQLTGDQLGALLGAFLLKNARPAPGGAPAEGLLVATTIVSSSLLSKIAAAAGARYAETLTGFKWISRAGDPAPGTRFVFGYEEAIGYMAGQTVRDKDGIGAALAVLAMATAARTAGRTLLDEYDTLEHRHGVHLTAQLSLRVPDTGAVMRRLRNRPPADLSGLPVLSITDYALPHDPDGSVPGGPRTRLPASDVLRFTLAGARVLIRPSGTEPKIKAYLEVVEPVTGARASDPASGLAAARLAAADRLTPLRAAVRDLLG